MIFKVYVNNNGKAEYSGNVEAATYEEAIQQVVNTGIEEKNFMLLK